MQTDVMVPYSSGTPTQFSWQLDIDSVPERESSNPLHTHRSPFLSPMPVSTDDPLDAVLRPPPGESPEERLVRLETEAEAKRISQAIDADIKAEKVARRKKRIVRLLLLGQSESGKCQSFFSVYEYHFLIPLPNLQVNLRL